MSAGLEEIRRNPLDLSLLDRPYIPYFEHDVSNADETVSLNKQKAQSQSHQISYFLSENPNAGLPPFEKARNTEELSENAHWIANVHFEIIKRAVNECIEENNTCLDLSEKGLICFPIVALLKDAEIKNYFCTQMTILNLGDNKISGPIPAEFGQFLQLEKLYLYGNKFSGAIPAELGQLVKLTWLELQVNKLKGLIPSALGRLSHLEALGLGENQLSGDIPPELWQLTQLKALGLEENDLTGTIPSEIGQLINLVELSLNSNEFTGVIPPALGNLTMLKVLRLYDNQFSGTIPEALWPLPELTSFSFFYNNLSDPIPDKWLQRFDKHAFEAQRPTSDVPQPDSVDQEYRYVCKLL